jgi:hypothetical protein
LNARERDICWLSVQTRIPFCSAKGRLERDQPRGSTLMDRDASRFRRV